MQTTSTVKVFVRVKPKTDEKIEDEEEIINVTNDDTVVSIKRDKKAQADFVFSKIFSKETEQKQLYQSCDLVKDVISGVNCCVMAYGQTGSGKTYTMYGSGWENNNNSTTIHLPKDINLEKEDRPSTGNERRAQSPAFLSLTATETIDNNDENLGIIPRAITDLFKLLETKSQSATNFDYSINCQVMQIYNEKIYDMLQDRRRENPLPLRELKNFKKTNGTAPSGKDEDLSNKGSIHVPGMSVFRVYSRDEAVNLLRRALKNRATRATDFNTESSRSHTILQLFVSVEEEDKDGFVVLKRSTFSLVDLAGSEKWRASLGGNNGSLGSSINLSSSISGAHPQNAELREMTNINTSLHVLGNCVSALTETNRRHIPYRDSVLTRLLQDPLSGHGRTVLIATVHGDQEHLDETYSTLQFASRASKIKVNLTANVGISTQASLQDAQKQIQVLRSKLTEYQNQKQLDNKIEGNELNQQCNSCSMKEEEISSLSSLCTDLKNENCFLKQLLNQAGIPFETLTQPIHPPFTPQKQQTHDNASSADSASDGSLSVTAQEALAAAMSGVASANRRMRKSGSRNQKQRAHSRSPAHPALLSGSNLNKDLNTNLNSDSKKSRRSKREELDRDFSPIAPEKGEWSVEIEIKNSREGLNISSNTNDISDTDVEFEEFKRKNVKDNIKDTQHEFNSLGSQPENTKNLLLSPQMSPTKHRSYLRQGPESPVVSGGRSVEDALSAASLALSSPEAVLSIEQPKSSKIKKKKKSPNSLSPIGEQLKAKTEKIKQTEEKTQGSAKDVKPLYPSSTVSLGVSRVSSPPFLYPTAGNASTPKVSTFNAGASKISSNPTPTVKGSILEEAPGGRCQKHGLEQCVLCSMFGGNNGLGTQENSVNLSFQSISSGISSIISDIPHSSSYNPGQAVTTNNTYYNSSPGYTKYTQEQKEYGNRQATLYGTPVVLDPQDPVSNGGFSTSKPVSQHANGKTQPVVMGSVGMSGGDLVGQNCRLHGVKDCLLCKMRGNPSNSAVIPLTTAVNVSSSYNHRQYEGSVAQTGNQGADGKSGGDGLFRSSKEFLSTLDSMDSQTIGFGFGTTDHSLGSKGSSTAVSRRYENVQKPPPNYEPPAPEKQIINFSYQPQKQGANQGNMECNQYQPFPNSQQPSPYNPLQNPENPTQNNPYLSQQFKGMNTQPPYHQQQPSPYYNSSPSQYNSSTYHPYHPSEQSSLQHQYNPPQHHQQYPQAAAGAAVKGIRSIPALREQFPDYSTKTVPRTQGDIHSPRTTRPPFQAPIQQQTATQEWQSDPKVYPRSSSSPLPVPSLHALPTKKPVIPGALLVPSVEGRVKPVLEDTEEEEDEEDNESPTRYGRRALGEGSRASSAGAVDPGEQGPGVGAGIAGRKKKKLKKKKKVAVAAGVKTYKTNVLKRR